MQEIAALLFGAAVIAIFSYDRFNIASFETEARLQRLGDLLKPNKMRARSVVQLSFLLYLTLLLSVYLGLCLYARLYPGDVLGLFGNGGDPVGAQLDVPSGASDGNVVWPVGMALAIVGLGPSLPLVRKSEAWLRSWTHRLVGIPTQVLEKAQQLKRAGKDIAFPAPGEDQAGGVFRTDDAKLMEDLAKRPDIIQRDDLLPVLRLIATVSAWILDNRLNLEFGSERRALEGLEQHLRDRKEALFAKLRDTMTVLAASQNAAPAEAGTNLSDTWNAYAYEAEDLADDIRLFLALLVEHQILTAPKTKIKTGATALYEYLGAIISSDEALSPDRILMTTLGWIFWILVLVGVVWGVFFGTIETMLTYPDQQEQWGGSRYSHAIELIMTLILSYFIPLIVGLSIWHAQLKTGGDRKRHWTESLPQALRIIFAGWFVACLSITAWAMLKSLLAQQAVTEGAALWDRWLMLMEYNAPMTFRGGILAVLMIMLVDHLRAAPEARPDGISARWMALWFGLATGFIGAITRATMIYWSLCRYGDCGEWRAEDRGLLVYAAVQAGLIGAAAAFCVISTLQERYQRKQTTRARA